MKKVKSTLIYFFCIAFLISCNNKSHETEKAVSHFMGQSIILPKTSKTLYRDSLYKKQLLRKEPKLKITTLLWGDCHSCIKDLKEWEDFYQYSNTKENIEIMFYLFTSDLDFFRENLYTENIYNFPLIIDQKNNYMVKNDIPFNKKLFQTFLLDSNNRVILVGNPIYSDKLMKLYKEEINKRLD